jgi:hypothetical protein
MKKKMNPKHLHEPGGGELFWEELAAQGVQLPTSKWKAKTSPRKCAIKL